MYNIDYYESERGDMPVREFLVELTRSGNAKEIAQIDTVIKRLEEYGMDLNRYFSETIRKLNDDIYELRPGSNRVFFFCFTGGTFVLLHCYKKKGNKAPPREIARAETEMKSYLRRHRNE